MRWLITKGNFWWGGLESLALSPLRELETYTASNTGKDDGARNPVKNLRLDNIFAAES